MDDTPWIKIGRYRAVISPDADGDELRRFIAELPSSLSDARILQAGRHVTSCTCLHDSGTRIVVKQFGRQGLLKDICDGIGGTKAFRTYAAATFMTANGVATVPPMACVEEWRGMKLAGSCFISRFMCDTVCFKDKLAEIWRHDGIGIEDIISLVARGIRHLHDSGSTHGDLGNQNIELVADESGKRFADIAFLDLNRSRFGKTLSLADRASDLSRIALPYGLYDDFFLAYWNGRVPDGFMWAYRLRRCLFMLHGKTRKFRHPFRELKYVRHPETAPASAGYPRMISVSQDMPEGKYTDSRAKPLSREQVTSLPRGTKVYVFDD